MKGYTLIEVIISLLLLAIILLGGTALFYQNLKSSGLGDVDLNLSTSLRTILSSLEKDLRFGQVVSVGLGNRADCVSAGTDGRSGDTLTVTDLNGLETIYSLEDFMIASTSSQTGNKVFISPPDVKINRLNFTWYCQGSVSDKMNVEIDASSTVLGSGVAVTRSVSTEVNLLNSGIN